MKKYLFSLALMLVTMFTTANAMSYEQAREQALFLTDKMAYELNLNEEQYDAAYEVNLDYLMSVNTVDDVYAAYWTRRNLDMSYILFDWQYRLFCDATYFYRPLYWDAGCWHFGIYARYPHRDYFYFSHPTVYVSYRGAHAWHINGGRSWYHNHFTRPAYVSHSYVGMRDNWHRGTYRSGVRTSGSNAVRGNRGESVYNRGNRNDRGNGVNRGNSSYRDRNNSTGNSYRDHGNSTSGSNRDRNNSTSNSYRDRENHSSVGSSEGTSVNRGQGATVNRGQGTTVNRGDRSYGGNRESSTRTTVNRGSSSISHGGSSVSTPSRSNVGSVSRGGSSMGSGMSRGGGSMGGGMSRGGGHSSGSRGGGGGHR